MKLKVLTLSALSAAFIFIATIIIQIPNGIGGYIHFGDAMIFLFAFILPTPYAMLAAGLGSCFADLLSGYSIYVLPTFIIKALMAYCFKKQLNHPLVGYLFSISILILGYFLVDAIIYQSFAIAFLSIVPNLLQGITAIILSQLLAPMLKNMKVFS